MTDDVIIRPFTDEDYEPFCALGNMVWPEYPETPTEMRYQDASRDPKIVHGRLIAEDASGFVGLGNYGQNNHMYHPQRFHIDVLVRPDRERQGIGSALYDALLAALAPFDPLWLRTEVREDKAPALRFVERRGFAEDQREQESKLDISGFDAAAFSADVERVRESGIEIVSLAQLKERDPEFLPLLYELGWELSQDVPSPAPPTRPTYENWLKRFDNPNFLLEGGFVALDGNKYIGLSTLRASQSNNDLDTGLTGVLRDYRKRGIASALKVHALTYAKARGAGSVRTWNEVDNIGMLGINFRLGFVRQPVWISFVNTLPAKENKENAA